MKTDRRWIVGLALAMLGLLGAEGDLAGRQPLGGHAVIESKDLVHGTVTLNGHAYQVVPSTRLLNRSGAVIGLRELPVAKVDRNDPKVDVSAMAVFQAVETGSGPVLESLQLRAPAN